MAGVVTALSHTADGSVTITLADPTGKVGRWVGRWVGG